jgi:capsular exopolysaccharide synthesis family protein
MPLPPGIPPTTPNATGTRPAGEGPPAALAAAPNALTLLKSLRRCWLRAIAFGLVVASIAAIAAWRLVPVPAFTARTLIRVPPGGRVMFQTTEVVPTLPDYQRTQVALVKSRMVLNAAIRQQGIADLSIFPSSIEPVEWLEKQIQADFSVAPEVLRISLSGDNLDDLKQLVTAIRKAYIDDVVVQERTDRRQRLEILSKQRQMEADKLRVMQEANHKLELEGASKANGMRGMLQMYANLQLNWFQKDLVQTDSDLTAAKADLAVRKAAYEDLPKTLPPDAELQLLLSTDPVIAQAQHEVNTLKAQVEQNAQILRGPQGAPVLQRQKNALAEAEQKLLRLKNESTPQATEAWRAAQRATAVGGIHQLETRVKLLVETQAKLTDRVNVLRSEIQRNNEINIKLDIGGEKTAELEHFVKAIIDEEQKRKFELDALPDQYKILEDTTVLRASDDKRVLMATTGTFLATFAVVLAAFALIEFRARRIGTVDEVVHGLGMNLIGAIPDSSVEASGGQVTGDLSGHNTLAEAIDATRVMLLREARSQMMRVVMVTSAHSGEGKTSLSTHLAASLAQTGLRTLLIDGDLRNPIAHELFELEVAPGFCELLRGEVRPQDVIRTTRIDRLSMISAGRWSGGASRALAQDEIAGRIIRQFASEYDYVIIDSSPVLPVVDPLLIGQLADGTILSVLRDVSRMPSVYAAHQRLVAGGVRVLGAVVSGVRGEAYGAAYPYRQRVGA